MDNYNYADLAKDEKFYKNKIVESDGEILKDIESKFGIKWIKAIKECMQESEACEYIPIKIVNKPRGEKQAESYGAFKFIYVNQTTNGGYEGDDFAGEVYIPLPDKTFLEFSYSM